MDPRARYPPDIGNGRGRNPYYYGRGPPPHQQHHQQQPPPPHAQAHHHQYVQRQQQPSQHHNYQQHQQWLRRNQIAGEGAGAAGASDHKAPPAADGIDPRVTASELLKPAAGTTDGPGAFDFKQGDVKGNPFWKLVRNLLKPPGKEQVECQAPKPILLDTGEMKEPYDWAPAILPIQMIRIGQLVILCVPGEFTTMAGRRLRDAVKNVLTSGSNGEFNNNIHVVLAGLTNTYSQYVTTFEEYQIQRYEIGYSDLSTAAAAARVRQPIRRVTSAATSMAVHRRPLKRARVTAEPCLIDMRSFPDPEVERLDGAFRANVRGFLAQCVVPAAAERGEGVLGAGGAAWQVMFRVGEGSEVG